MLEGVVIRNTPPLKVIIYLWRKALLGKKFILWTINGINDSLANPGRAPISRTKSVTKKEMNKCMAEIYEPGGIQTRATGLISQYHNH